MKGILLFGFLSFCFCHSYSQSNISIQFHFFFGDSILSLENKTYVVVDTNKIKFETLRFYISSVQLLNNDSIVYTEENSFHLIDADDANSLQISLNQPSLISFNQIKFNIGIDSTTNISGALGGDLDPTKGMYWTWQSGYINFKVEGNLTCSTNANHTFQFHLGGYQFPFNACHAVQIPVLSNQNIDLNFDLKKFIDRLDLSKQNHVMSPGPDAILLSTYLGNCFSSK